MDDYKKYFSKYTCPKCRGRSFNTEEVTFNHSSKKFLLRGRRPKYLLVSCGLCGYTEMYNLCVFVAHQEEVLAEEASPAVE